MNTHLLNVKKLINKSNLDGVLISSVPNIIYLTGLAYFSPHEREAFLLITKNNNYILTDARYSYAVRQNLPAFKLLEISSQHSLTDLLKETFQKENIKSLGLETDNITLHEAEKIKPFVVTTRHFDLSSLRKIKKAEEISLIKKACALGDKAFSHIVTIIKGGITEKEVAFELEHFIRKHGAEPSFPTIVAFQENATIPHHKTSNRRLNRNEFILLDFGVKYEEYCSDMTRTIFFGKANEEQKKAYQTVLEAQKKAIECITRYCHSEAQLEDPPRRAKNPTAMRSFANAQDDTKIEASRVDQAARDYIISQSYPSIPHSLGHGIGLEVHEAPTLSPKSKDNLTEGMVFSIEPGIYVSDKFGIRIEDLFAIQEGKLIKLTKSSNELIEVSSPFKGED